MINFKYLEKENITIGRLVDKKIANEKLVMKIAGWISVIVGSLFFIFSILYLAFKEVYKLIWGHTWILEVSFFVSNISLWIYVRKENNLKSYLLDQKERVSMAPKNLQIIQKKIVNNSDFILYLRDFAGGKQESSTPVEGMSPGGMAANSVMSSDVFGKQTTNACIEFFSQKYPVVMLNNIQEKTVLHKNALLMYPPDVLWVETFAELAILAKYTIIDFDFNFLTESIKLEIQTLIQNQRKNILFVGTKECYEILKLKHEILSDLLICHIHAQVRRDSPFRRERLDIDFAPFLEIEKNMM